MHRCHFYNVQVADVRTGAVRKAAPGARAQSIVMCLSANRNYNVKAGMDLRIVLSAVFCAQPLANAKHYGFKQVCEILEKHGGTEEPSNRGSPGSAPEYEIDPSELDWEKGVPIGKGAFGEIRLVNWRGTRVAVKTILHDLASNVNVVKEFRDELGLLQKLRHPNIVQFLGAVTQSLPLMLVTEYLPKGDLHDIIRRRGAMNAGTALRYALDIARGMAYLHQNRPHAIVHRDLKPRNLLQDEAGHLKVADFGLSKFLKAKNDNVHDVYLMTGETGSYRYMAPEVFKHEKYDKSVDVFSFAMITYEMFEGGPAYKYQLPGDIARDFAMEDLRPPFKARTYPDGLKKLLSECWSKDPRSRPSFVEIVERLEKMESSIPKIASDMPRCQCTIM
ncbi:hypothetical protein CBR_g24251 [Chara braunii]|uniref:non-specific serine/threonine protein kinase n=1 Tax=Chara braunii TaxID=69332 RepID=A0A388JM53_CHABU|nr:hypothetical protein CBR_g24251 [Chara braunii]|eukprot:GBG58900.1 hypothetical protein CBR_g24251 [Chara braunii]